MANSEVKWNPEQLNAITSLGGNLLVSAAAGSGKTAVLIERIIRIITDENHPTDVDRLLVITFTKLAAAQMKSKLYDALSKKIKEEPDNKLLRRQQILMEKANICTIDAFILQIVLEYFNTVGIAPDSSIGDDEVLKSLSADAMDEAEEKFLGLGDDSFKELMETFETSGKNGGLESITLQLYNFIRSFPNYENWLREKASMYAENVPVSDSVWGQIILHHALECIEGHISTAKYLLGEATDMGCDVFISTLESDISLLKTAKQIISNEKWDNIENSLLSLKFTTSKNDKNFDQDFYELLKDQRAKYKSTSSGSSVKKIASLFSVSEKEFREDIDGLYPKIKCLFDFTMEYDKIFTEKKKDAHLLDFSDVQKFALDILSVLGENGEMVKSEAANIISNRFDYILIDECQDINSCQDTIFSMLSNGKNLFYVGDVKQSIYKFRQARPELFMKKRDTWPALNDSLIYPATIILGRNYRSRKNITDGVNYIFGQIMNKKSAEMDYTDEEKLIPEAAYPESDIIRNRMVMIKGEKDNDADTEALWIANDVKNLVESDFMIFDKGTERPIKYSDICILMRHIKGRSEPFIKAFKSLGISCICDKGSTFLSRPEISAVINVLRAIDNPLLDIPLVGAMVSEMFSFTPDDLCSIRIEKKKMPFYSSVKQSADEGNEKCQSFIDFIDNMRHYAASEPSDSVIEKLYTLTSFPQIMKSCEGGESSSANLRLLVRYAQEYESSGHHGLSNFVKYITKAMDSQRDFAASAYAGKGSNCVHIMTVHSSKGLEFPVVYLCGTRHKFHRPPAINEPVFHPELGFACSRRDQETGYRFRTVPQVALEIAEAESDLPEEMRILYVAMTRAKENLTITCVSKNPEKYIASLAQGARTTESRLSAYNVSSASCESDWILTALLRHPCAKDFRDIAMLDSDCILNDETKWKFVIEENEETAETDTISLAEAPQAEPDEKLAEAIKKRFEWVYPYKVSESIPSKAGVSEITHGKISKDFLFSKKPAGKILSGAERGTAVHKFMQFCDFDRASIDPKEEVEHLIKQKYLTQSEGNAVNINYVKRFFESDIYTRIKESSDCRREYRIISSIPAKELGFEGACEDDLITIQGVTDIIFRENGRFIIVDYKTDKVNSMDDLLYRYGEQLKLYAKLLEKSFGVVVSEAVIWSFHLGESISVLIV